MPRPHPLLGWVFIIQIVFVKIKILIFIDWLFKLRISTSLLRSLGWMARAPRRWGRWPLLVPRRYVFLLSGAELYINLLILLFLFSVGQGFTPSWTPGWRTALCWWEKGIYCNYTDIFCLLTSLYLLRTIPWGRNRMLIFWISGASSSPRSKR